MGNLCSSSEKKPAAEKQLPQKKAPEAQTQHKQAETRSRERDWSRGVGLISGSLPPVNNNHNEGLVGYQFGANNTHGEAKSRGRGRSLPSKTVSPAPRKDTSKDGLVGYQDNSEQNVGEGGVNHQHEEENSCKIDRSRGVGLFSGNAARYQGNTEQHVKDGGARHQHTEAKSRERDWSRGVGLFSGDTAPMINRPKDGLVGYQGNTEQHVKEGGARHQDAEAKSRERDWSRGVGLISVTRPPAPAVTKGQG